MVIFTLDETADLLKVNKETLRRWDRSGKLKAKRNPILFQCRYCSFF